MKDKSTKCLAIHIIMWVAIVALAYLPFSSGSNIDQDDYPRKPIEIVVPFKAGGGSDVLVRMFQKVINKNEILPVPLVVVNRPGASATDGSRFVKDAEPDGYTMLNLHDAIIISKHFGKVDYGPEAFEPIAATLWSGTVIVVRDDSPYNNLEDLIQDAKKRPKEIIYGCALGTPTHVSGLLLEKEAGVKFNLIQSGGGAARLEQLMGKHIQATSYAVSEYLSFKSQGLKALAFLGDERHDALPDLPTAKEFGVNASFNVMQYWWFPKGTDKTKVKVITDAFKKALEYEELISFIEKNKMTHSFLTDEAFDERIKTVESKISNLESEKAHDLPPFHLIVIATLSVFLTYIIWDNLKKKSPVKSEPLNYKPAVVTLGIFTTYIFLMSRGIVDFRVLTFAFMVTLGIYLSPKKVLNKTVLVECALFISLGTYYVFTKIVHVDLP
ncbi:MAG: tripartite tricarboxylate transporter substrate binding protein [Lentisphaerales bacterium]|nr:tripartite tricarboxylate transporter substrate binding protein [Lentisphaerales bacterium]